MLKKRILSFALLAVLCFTVGFSASAAGTDSFTHWDSATGGKKAVYSKDVYKTETVISARSLGLDTDILIQDITGDKNGDLYILTSDGGILVVDEKNSLKKILTVSNGDGSSAELSEPKGIYASEDELFIADTSGERVLICDKGGKIKAEIGRPESSVLPDDFNFLPTKITRDSKGYIYVISEGAYYGALLFDTDYEFISFYGANTVNATVLSVLGNLWDMLTKNDEKRGNEMKKLPYQFLDITLDAEDFAYTCTGVASGDSVGQLRALSPGGSNILEKNSGTGVISSTSFNFAEADTAKRRGENIQQSFVSVAVDSQGFIYGLDSIYGLIYVYDSECNLITAFGGGKDSGDREGTYAGALAVEIINDRAYVADNQHNNVTVYTKTDYGTRVLNAQELTLDGRYADAEAAWTEISNEDQNNRLALAALGKAAYSKGDYKTAMEYSRLSLDRVTYDQAMQKNQEAFISEYFAPIFILIVAALGGIVALIIISLKRKVVLIKNRRLRICFTCCIHPFADFNEIKFKNGGSVLIGSVLTLLYFVSAVVKIVYTDFRFTSFDASTYNPIFQLLTTVGLVVLWSVGNWLVSVLQEGKGKYKEVFIVTSYAVFPLILGNFISTAASHFITSSSDVFLSGINTVAIILAGIILVIGTMVVQEFSFPKFVITAILTVLAMILIIFIIFMIGMLLSQLWQFVLSVATEVIYR